MTQTGGVAEGRLSDWISLGVLASWVPRDAVDDAVEATGKGAKRKGGKLPPHVMVYFAMALALFAGEDYEETWTRLSETLADWGCWDPSQGTVTTGGLTQARQRLGHEPVEKVFAQVAVPPATEDTAGAFLGPWRKMSMDGLEWDIPATEPNIAAFGFPGTAKDAAPAAFPKARAVTVGECASHAPVLAAIGPCVSKGSGEQSLARGLYPQLEPDWLLMADRNFYNWQDWCTAADTGAALLWRVKSDLRLDPLEFYPDGSYRSVLVNPKVKGKARDKILDAARGGEDLDPEKARYVRVVEYEVPDREGDGKDEIIALESVRFFVRGGFLLPATGCLSGVFLSRYLKFICPVYVPLFRNRAYPSLPGQVPRVRISRAIPGACCLILLGSRGGCSPCHLT